MPRFGEESYYPRGGQIANFYQDFGQREALQQQQAADAMRLALTQRGGERSAENTRRRWEALASIPEKIGQGYYEGKEEKRKGERERRSEEEHAEAMKDYGTRRAEAAQRMEAGELGLQRGRSEAEYYGYAAPKAPSGPLSEEGNAAAPVSAPTAGGAKAPGLAGAPLSMAPGLGGGGPGGPSAGGPKPRYQVEHEAELARQAEEAKLSGQVSRGTLATQGLQNQFTGFQMATAKTEAEKARIGGIRTGAAQMFANASQLKAQNPNDPQAADLEARATANLKAAGFDDQTITQVKTADAAKIALDTQAGGALAYTVLNKQAQDTLAQVNTKIQALSRAKAAVDQFQDTSIFNRPDIAEKKQGLQLVMANAGLGEQFQIAEQNSPLFKGDAYKGVLDQEINAQVAALQQARSQAQTVGDKNTLQQIDNALFQLSQLGGGGGQAMGGIIRAPGQSYRGGAKHEQTPALGTSNAGFMQAPDAAQPPGPGRIPPGRPPNMSIQEWMRQQNRQPPPPRGRAPVEG